MQLATRAQAGDIVSFEDFADRALRFDHYTDMSDDHGVYLAGRRRREIMDKYAKENELAGRLWKKLLADNLDGFMSGQLSTRVNDVVHGKSSYGKDDPVAELKQHTLLFDEGDIWDTWFKVLGESRSNRRWPILNDSLSILMAAEQGQGIALSRWSLVARDIEAGRLVRPIPKVVKTDWSYFIVSPPHYFDIPKVVFFRKWMEESSQMFEKPEQPALPE